MGDFITNSQTSLASLKDQCQLLQNVLHDVLVLEVGDQRLAQVRRFRYLSCPSDGDKARQQHTDTHSLHWTVNATGVTHALNEAPR